MKKRTSSVIVSTLTLLIVLSSAALLCAEDKIKLATVDINHVLNSLDAAKESKERLDKETAKAKKQIEIKRKALREKDMKLQAKGVSSTSDEAEKYRKEVREFERYVKDTEAEIKRDFLKINKTLTEKALAKIREYAKENNIQLVLDKGGQGRSVILFDANTYDITSAVIKKLNG